MSIRRRGSAGYALGGRTASDADYRGDAAGSGSVVVITTTPKKKNGNGGVSHRNGISAAGIVRDRTGLIRGDSRVAN